MGGLSDAFREKVLHASQEKLPVSGLETAGREILVPEMEEDEVLAGTAPFGKQLVPLVMPDGISTQEFKMVVGICFTYYMANDGKLPDLEHVIRASTLGQVKTKAIYEHPQFRRALRIRGINPNPISPISPEQDIAMAIMATPDGRPFDKKLKAAGVAPSRWRAWLKQKAFREAWNAIGGTVLTEHENDLMVALVGQGLNGDVGAIKYAFEVSGKHNPAKKDAVDAQMMIARIIEILQEEVKDTETLQRIAARMALVASVQSSAAPRLIEG